MCFPLLEPGSGYYDFITSGPCPTAGPGPHAVKGMAAHLGPCHALSFHPTLMLACTCIHNLHHASDCSSHADAHSPRTSQTQPMATGPFQSAGISLASLAHKISHARNVRYNFIGFCATGALSHDIHGAKSGSADAPPSHPPLPASALQQQPASAAFLAGTVMGRM